MRLLGQIRSKLIQGWRAANALGAGLLCLRFLFVLFRDPDLRPSQLLALGAFALGFWRPQDALFAFTLAIPLLSGLTQTTQITGPSALLVVFSALWLGLWLRRTNGGNRHVIQASGKMPSVHVASLITVDLLISAVLLSLGGQIWQHWDTSDFRNVIWSEEVQGYGSPLYFLTSAFVWLQGLHYFRFLINGNRELSPTLSIRRILAIHFVTALGFCLFQAWQNLPEGWTYGYQSPFEDISSFGSIAVSLFVFFAAALAWDTWAGRIGNLVLLLTAAGLVIASWSRGAWLAGMTFGLIVATLRLPRRILFAAVGGAAAILIVINVNAENDTWKNQPYLSRLVTLVRFEKPSVKGADRLELYHKAWAMVSARPLTGHGVGSFYLTSVRYARAGDPHASWPDFAHNALLLVAAEQGAPVAILYAGFFCSVLVLGSKIWLQEKKRDPTPPVSALTALGVTLAIGAYLQTQMTANSLNVYVSNQFFLWLLVASVVTLAQPPETVG